MVNVESVRRFNRFYTRRIGALDEGLLHSPFSLSEARVLYEIAQREQPTAAQLAEELRLDPGYLSRMLRRFDSQGLVRRQSSADDGRQSLLSLTAKGRTMFASLNARQHDEIAGILAELPAAHQRKLVEAMATIEQILGAPAASAATPYLLRQHQLGDMGWVVHRHGVLYGEDGYDIHFEGLVAKIVADFVAHYDPARERCWIAQECDDGGEIVGSVFVVKKSATVAKLRLLYVEPRARGRGIGERLVSECIRFARQARYRKLALWTHGHLGAARHIYDNCGFTRTAAQPEHSFGRDAVSETWELVL